MRDVTVDHEGSEKLASALATGYQRQLRTLDYAALLDEFRRQAITINSILFVVSPWSHPAAGVALFNVNPHDIEPSAKPIFFSPDRTPQSLQRLSEHVQQLSRSSRGDTLIVIDDESLEALLMAQRHSEFGIRSLALLSSHDPVKRGEGWRSQRALFDLGLIIIGSINLEGEVVRCFLASEALTHMPTPEIASRGDVTMTSLGRNGGFGNQLFQYAYVKLYALRHGLTAKFPYWQGRELYRLADPLCGGAALQQLSFNGFTDNDLRLWEDDNPPINIDLWGYFQETPVCWRPHRQLLRQMFSPADWQTALDGWRNELTRGGERSLVALHVRRGDYRTHTSPYFQSVPEQLYIDWLREIWPTLSDPLLFVATDEPESVLGHFAQFSPLSDIGTLDALPAHVRDFEILRRADYLAACNSSYSRMAAILANDAQKCFLPSYKTGRFEPYQPWLDAGFWTRFAKRLPPPRVAEPAPGKHSVTSRAARPTIYIDVSDLLLYLLDHSSLSGIQRVQCEVVRHLADAGNGEVDFVALEDGEGLVLIEAPALLEIIDLFRSGAISRTEIRVKIISMMNCARRCLLRDSDIFLTLGAFWGVRGAGRLLQQLKNSGVVIGLFIHDIIPITHPEYFQARDTRVFVKAVVEALTFADFVLTSSEYNKGTIATHSRSRGLNPQIDVVPLAHQFTKLTSEAPDISEWVRRISESPFVLCVGTIEVRKNPLYLFNLWKLMARSEQEVPTLVFAGRRGWLVQDFIEQLENCGYLDGKVIILNNVTDGELDLLYRRCILTVFPSFAEGWGLPVGESLAYGKICICAAAGGTSEVGRALADYVDPYNVRSGLEQLLHYLNNPEARSRREQIIAQSFEHRSWREVAGDLLAAAKSMHFRVARGEGIAAITLPPNKFMPITVNAREFSLTAEDGSLSAELACVAGWRAPEVVGVWAERPEATLQFRTKSAPGAKIHLILRLACLEGSSYRLRIKSAAGSEVSVSLGGGSDTFATLWCEVDKTGLVNVSLSCVDQEKRASSRGYWCLKGFMYVEPDALKDTQKRADRSERWNNATPWLAFHADGERIRLCSAPAADGIRQLSSKEEFINAKDAFWSLPTSIRNRRSPVFVDAADERLFFTRYWNSQRPHLGAVSESATLLRRSRQYLSASRFTEGVIFDPSGVRRGFGFLDGAPLSHNPWLLRDREGLAIERGSLHRAPHYDHSFLVFYNGNLHNYYHWLVEGLLPLDILVNSLLPDKNICIALPKSMDINPLFDHRASLTSFGFDNINVIEIGDDLVNVAEVIWLECDLVENMPAQFLKNFQRRIAAKYATLVKKRSRRLLIERKGPTRMIGNFDAVQALLSQEGFETVSLEGMSPSDQILLFQSAEFVVGAHGAGLANLLFCEHGTKVIELMPSVEMRPFFWIISDSLELHHAVLFCSMIDGGTFQATLEVDISKLTALYKTLDVDQQ